MPDNLICTDHIELPDNGGEVKLQISTNERWTASSDGDWYMITPALETCDTFFVIFARADTDS